MKNTAVFCGSFDPIHIGHAMMASQVSEMPGIDELWLMPSRINPLKAGTPPAADHHRLAMCSLVADRCPKVSASDAELQLPAPSYTYATLTHLRQTHPDRHFMLLIGSDNWLCFDRWCDHDRIIAEFPIVIYPRPGHEIGLASLPEGVRLLEEAPQMLVSSTYIRHALATGGNTSFLLTDEVREYITAHNLYREMIV